MIKKSLILLAICLWPFMARGEKAYFQQRADYNIKADIDPQTAKISGIESIAYVNNSPDSLSEIYFHLYFNAFQPGSYLDRQDRRAGDFRIANTPPRDQGNVEIDIIRVNGSTVTDFVIDNTLMSVPLTEPLPPGDSAVFYIEFTSQIPVNGSRAGWRGKHFDIGQWYPKPAVYDRYGWHLHQYLDYEFYADYGDYDVELTMPSDYIIAHVGKLLNEEEIFGGTLAVPDGDSIIVDAVKNMVVDSSRAEEPDSLLNQSASGDSADSISRDSADVVDLTGRPDAVKELAHTKTWKIEASNIHDFAFCADPNFIIDIARYNNTIIKSYYSRSNKRSWERDAAFYTRESIKFFSEKYFPYPYGQYSTVSALAGGGMEYPQLTMINARAGRHSDTHGLESIIAHEVGHAWFYGILGFNETEQSYLDEGLTTFVTNLYLENRYGRYKNDYAYKNAWQRKFLPNGNERDDNTRKYIRRARMGDEDPMITPANLFADGGRYYSASYEKASSIYFMLQYTMGDRKFAEFMDLMFQRWAFKHPYLSDFQESAEEVYGGDLDWFFRQWFTTTWTLDYSLDKFSKKKRILHGISGFDTSIKVGKKGRCISPIDVAINMKDGSIDTVLIPLSNWEDGQLYFDTTVFLPSKPKNAIVNPDRRLADTYRLNNSSGLPPVRRQFLLPRIIYEDSYIEFFPDSYTLAHQPLLWYNSVDGASPGYRISGSFLGDEKKLDADASVGAMNGKVDYYIGYEDVFWMLNPSINYFITSIEEDGRGRQSLGLKYASGSHWYSRYFETSVTLKRNYLFDPEYLYGGGWSPGNINTIELIAKKGTRNRFSRIEISSKLTSSIAGGDYDFNRAEGAMVFTIARGRGNSTRITFNAGVANGKVPLQQRFYLSSADPYEVWLSPLFRSKGTLPDEWKDDGHLFMPGGAGLSGYLERGMTGTRMLSAKISGDLPRLNTPVRLPLISNQLRRISPELYVASGLVWDRGHNPKFNDYLSEAGITLKYDIPYLDRLIDESKLVLYLPLWLSDPSNNEDNFKWRWLFSLNP